MMTIDVKNYKWRFLNTVKTKTYWQVICRISEACYVRKLSKEISVEAKRLH